MPAPHFKRAVIHGVGLLGGSLGFALRERGIADEVVGLGRSREKLHEALRRGALTRISTNPSEALEGADALILCLPPRLIREKIAELAPLITPGAFVTDVGSVKGAIVREGEARLAGKALFIGSHPMAGSEKSGIDAARADLYEDAACFVTLSEKTPAEALVLATEFWRAVGCRVIVADPARHDALLAATSHLPHLAAAALVEALYSRGDATLFFKAVIGNGFRDTTRIAAGEAELWEQIFSENSGELVQNLDGLIRILESWRGLLSRGDARGDITERLARASAHRRELSGPEKDDA